MTGDSMGEEALVLGKRTTTIIVRVASEHRGRRHNSSDCVRVFALCIFATFWRGKPVPASQFAVTSRLKVVHVWTSHCSTRS